MPRALKAMGETDITFALGRRTSSGNDRLLACSRLRTAAASSSFARASIRVPRPGRRTVPVPSGCEHRAALLDDSSANPAGSEAAAPTREKTPRGVAHPSRRSENAAANGHVDRARRGAISARALRDQPVRSSAEIFTLRAAGFSDMSAYHRSRGRPCSVGPRVRPPSRPETGGREPAHQWLAACRIRAYGLAGAGGRQRGWRTAQDARRRIAAVWCRRHQPRETAPRAGRGA